MADTKNLAIRQFLEGAQGRTFLHLPCSIAVHPRQPHCLPYYWLIFRDVFLSSAKMYGVLFIVTGILRRKGWRYMATRIVPSTARSASFLAVFSLLFAIGNCWGIRLTGGNYPVPYFMSGFVAAFVSILVEHKSRRSELMLYTANVASEAIFNMLVNRGYVKRVRNGTTLIFAATWSLLCYLYACDRHSLDNVQGVVHTVLGDEHKPDSYERRLAHYYDKLKRALRGIRLPDHNAIVVHAGLGFLRGITCGFVLRAVLALLSLVGKPSRIWRKVWWIKNIKNVTRFAVLTAVLSGGTRSLVAILRAVRGKEDGINHLVSGFISGLSYKLFDSHEVAMLLGSKAASGLVCHLFSRAGMRTPEWGPPVLYAFNTAVIFYQSVFEQHNLRRSYWKFLLRVTNGDIQNFNELALHWRPLLGIPGPLDGCAHATP